MKLPTINEIKHKSRVHQIKLESAILEWIIEYEERTNHDFSFAEINNVLLKIIKRNTESQLNTDLGYDVIN